jgi:putative cell wall-binding protein
MRSAERLLQGFNSERDASNHSPQVQKLLAEWEQDRAMAKERYETGKEPVRRSLAVELSKKRKQKAPVRIKEQEIPF